MVAALELLLVFEVVGLLAAPLTALVLGRLPGAGLGFSKIFGLLLVTWVIWMAGSLHVVAYGTPLIVGVLVLLAVCGVLVGLRLRSLGERVQAGSRSQRLRRLALPEDPVRRRLFWGAEAVFVVCYALGALLPSYPPRGLGTRKAKGMGLIQPIQTSSPLPPP